MDDDPSQKSGPGDANHPGQQRFTLDSLPQSTAEVKRMAIYLARLTSINERLTRTVISNPKSYGRLLRATEAWLRASAWLDHILRNTKGGAE
jgi:hypothetical protein